MLKTKREEKYALQGYIDEQKQIIVEKEDPVHFSWSMQLAGSTNSN